MKMRQGFVSNSSSSSFVILGCRVTPMIKAELKAKFPKIKDEDGTEPDGDWLYRVGEAELDLNVYYMDSGYIIGKALAEVEEYSMSSANYTVSELEDMIKSVKKKLGEDAQIKLMMGTRPT